MPESDSDDGLQDDSLTSSPVHSSRSTLRPRASQTAQSVTSHVSSSRSIATTFSALDGEDVAFFDEVITRLSHGETSFVSLKASYQDVRAQWPRISEEKDAHLWNSLLSLVKVRGRDWSERWDAVRVEIGLDLKDADLTESSAATFEQEEDQSMDSRQGENQSHQAHFPSRHHWAQELSQSEGSDADHSSQSEDGEEDYWDQRRKSSAASSLTTLGADVGQSKSSSGGTVSATTPKYNRSRDDIAALQARMINLTRQAGALALQAGQQAALRAPSAEETHLNLAGETSSSRRDSTFRPQEASPSPKEYINRLLAQTRSDDEGTGEESSSSSVPTSPRQQRSRQRSTFTDRHDDPLSAVKSSHGSLRDQVYRRAQESEELAWQSSARFAQRHYEQHLLSACLRWWRQLCQRQSERQCQADGVKDSSLLLQSLTFWKHSALDHQPLEQTAFRADILRCQLSAWRKWRRRAKAVRAERWEGKKGQMRESYTLIKEKRLHRERTTSWEKWRSKTVDKRSTNFRNGHLLGGAFFVWRLKFEVANTLAGQEKQAMAVKNLALKRTVFEKWRIDTKLMGLLDKWEDEQAKQKCRAMLSLWKQRTKLEAMERAYSAHRLGRYGLRMWLQRLAESATNKRRQVQADRRLAKTTQRRALEQWRVAISHAVERDSKAGDFQMAISRQRLIRSFAEWRARARCSLFIRVRQGRLQKDHLDRWRAAFQDKATTLPHKAEEFFSIRSRGVVSACFAHWRQLQRGYKESDAQATAVASRMLLTGSLRKWQASKRRCELRMDQAVVTEEWFTLKRAFTSMREKVRSTKLQAFQEKHLTGLLTRSFTFWRACATQQSLDRLAVAHVQSLSSLRIERQALRHWTQRVIERRALLLEVGETYNETVLSKYLKRWRQVKGQVEDLQRLGQSFQDVKSEEFLRRNLLRWGSRYRKARSLRERAARFMTSREDRVLSQAFINWHDTWREGSLQSLEYEMAIKRQEDAKDRVLTTWIARTTSFPAIRFDHSRLKRLALKKWRDNLPGAILKRQAVELDMACLTKKAFRHWMESGKAKRAAKAAARFGGPSMARLRRHSSRPQSPFVVKPRRSSASGYRRSSSPLVAATSEKDQASDGGTSPPHKARSEVLEGGARASSGLPGSSRPRSEANFGSRRDFSVPLGEARSITSEPSLPPVREMKEGTKRVTAPTILPSRNALPPSARSFNLLGHPTTISSSSSRRSATGGEGDDTFSLTSHEVQEQLSNRRNDDRSDQDRGARRKMVTVRSLPSLSVAASEDEYGSRAPDEARTERPSSPLSMIHQGRAGGGGGGEGGGGRASAAVNPFARRPQTKQSLRTETSTRGSEAGADTSFLEDLRRRRRAMLERQTGL